MVNFDPLTAEIGSGVWGIPANLKTRMWANALCDGCPAEYRWHPFFNATKFGRRPLLECRAVTLPRRETR